MWVWDDGDMEKVEVEMAELGIAMTCGGRSEGGWGRGEGGDRRGGEGGSGEGDID